VKRRVDRPLWKTVWSQVGALAAGWAAFGQLSFQNGEGVRGRASFTAGERVGPKRLKKAASFSKNDCAITETGYHRESK
jgi:hypothetical protein